MPTIPIWLIASKGHVHTVSITPQSATLGVLADIGSAVILTGRLSGIDTNLQSEKAEINTITSPRQNSVVLSDGFSISMAILRVNNGTDIDPLLTAFRAAEYFKLSWVEGTVAGFINTYTAYVSRTSMNWNVQGRGEVIATFSGDSIDVGSADFFKVLVT